MKYYAILGVKEYMTVEEIKVAYHKLAMRYHPDHNKAPDASDRFREIKEAYDFLKKHHKPVAPPKPARPARAKFVGEQFFRDYTPAITKAENGLWVYMMTCELPIGKIEIPTRIWFMWNTFVSGTEFSVDLPVGTKLPLSIEITNVPSARPVRMNIVKSGIPSDPIDFQWNW